MAKVSLFFRPSQSNIREGVLCFRISHAGATAVVSTGIVIQREEWSSADSCICIPAAVLPERSQELATYSSTILRHRAALQNILAGFLRAGHPFHVSQIANVFRTLLGSVGFVSYAHDLIFRLQRGYSHVTARRYRTTINSFCRFLGDVSDVSFLEFCPSLLLSYESWLHSHGIGINSSSFYLRNLRAIFNRAVRDGVATPVRPFERVYTGIAKTVKRALDIDSIRRIQRFPLPEGSSADFARSLFLFSFYTRGMSFVDMAFLRKADIVDGRLTYCRQKTRHCLSILWEAPMQHIVDRFPTADSPYLLPIVSNCDTDVRQQYICVRQRVNRQLRILGERMGLPIPLTMYVARHSWASIAHNCQVPVAVISEALGHTSEHTTRIYLSSFEGAPVDHANHQVLSML